MSKCTPCDINTDDLFTKNQQRVNTTAITVKPNGEFSLDQVDVLLDDFNRNIVHEVRKNALERQIARFGDDFLDSVQEVQNFLDGKDLSDYPQLQARVNTGLPITNLEIANFYEENIYTPSKVTNNIATSPGKFQNELNCFFMGSAISNIMGGFCSTLQNVFGAVSGFFDLIGAVGGLINNALDALSKLQNLEDIVKAAFEKIKVKAIIEAIKDTIISAIKMHLKCVIDAVNNFVGVFDEIKRAGQRIDPKLSERYQELKDHVNKTFSEENQESLLRKIEGTIDYAVNRFANPALAEIEYLAFRMCGMASAIESLITLQKAPLDRFAEKIASTFDAAKNNSAPATAEAIEAGAIRLSDETRQEEINKTVDRCREAAQNASGEEDPDQFDPRRVNAPAITPDEVEGVPSYEDIASGNDARFTFGPGLGKNKMGADGWYGLTPETRVKLLRLQEKLGRRLQINSGYRSPEYNANLRPPGAKRSKHMSGTAIDITWSGFNRQNRNEAAKIAVSEDVGFKGIGYYNSFLHVDLGPTRTWGS